jgi:hypothetical protein
MSGNDLDRQRVARIIAMAGSRHDGEALNAVRTVDRLIREAGLSWEDLLTPFVQLEVAVEAARVLLEENSFLRAELDQWRSSGHTLREWREVGEPISSVRPVAEWALDLYRQKLCWLSKFEISFLEHCTKWVGRLPPSQEPRFQRIVDRAAERTGMIPPL